MSTGAAHPLLVCPACEGELTHSDSHYTCNRCRADYPLVGPIPGLWPQGQKAMAAWRLRLQALLGKLDGEVEQLKDDLKDRDLHELTQKRLRKMLQARVEQRKAFEALLAPLGVTKAMDQARAEALKVAQPFSMSLTGYYSNIHRDWAWETDENTRALEALKKVLPAASSHDTVCVLGSGAGRLVYDFVREFCPRQTVALDINPLLTLIAERMFRGRNLRLFEIPIAPRTLADHAIERKLSAPHGALAGDLELVLGDAMRPPLRRGSFDLVITPWFIDIIPELPDHVGAVINNLLKPGGYWINSGSLAPARRNESANPGQEETVAMITGKGFAIVAEHREVVPYMQSPASCHGRLEEVWSFCARKTGDTAWPTTAEDLPAWLQDDTLPVPRLKQHDVFQTIHSVYVAVVALIDGKRTVRDIARSFGATYGLPPEEAYSAVTGFLTRHLEESRRGKD